MHKAEEIRPNKKMFITEMQFEINFLSCIDFSF